MARSVSRTRWLAIALAVAITIPYLAIFIQTIRAIRDPESVSREMLRELASLGAMTQGDQVGIAFSYLAAIVGAVTLVVVLIIVGLVVRRQAAREAAFAVFGTFALISGLAGIGTLIGRSPSSGSWLGAGTAAACLGVIILLALGSTSRDFELAEMERGRRRQSSPAEGHRTAAGEADGGPARRDD
jgi:lipoprotein signal peptidase